MINVGPSAKLTLSNGHCFEYIAIDLRSLRSALEPTQLGPSDSPKNLPKVETAYTYVDLRGSDGEHP